MSESELSLKSVYEEFLKFEDEYSLFNAKIDRVFFWERVRFAVFRAITIKLAEGKIKRKKRIERKKEKKFVFYLRKIRNYLKVFFQFNLNPLLAKKKTILVLSSSRRKLKENGKWWDIYTDHIINKMIYSSISIEGDFEFNFRTPAETKNLRYFTYIDLMVDLKRYLKISKVNLTDGEIIYLRKISQAFNSKFNRSIDLVEIVHNNLVVRKRSLPYYRKILKKVQPQLVLIVCSYGKENFIEACKEREIPVVEIQHGVVTRYHVGYSFEEYRTKKTFPDYIFAFGDYWKESITYPIEKDKIFSIGFPDLEISRKKYEEIEKKKQIVFISQPWVGIHLSKVAVELNKVENLAYKVIYKLHPNEVNTWKEEFPWLLKSGIEVVNQEGKGLYELFAESEIQVGVNSTALFEGLFFGVKTLLFDYFGIDYMEDLLKSKVAEKFSDVDDLVKKIKKIKETEFDTDYFFRHNSLKNAATRLKKMIEKKE